MNDAPDSDSSKVLNLLIIILVMTLGLCVIAAAGAFSIFYFGRS